MSLQRHHFPSARSMFEDLFGKNAAIFSSGHFQQFDKDGSGAAEMNMTEVGFGFLF